MKNLLIPIILLTFVSCGEKPMSKTAIYQKDCDDRGCVCKGYTGVNEVKSISVFKCDSTVSVGDTILTKFLQ